MIEALYKKKCLLEYIKPNISAEDQKEHKSKEDTKTSSILGTLFLLPETLIFNIFAEACKYSEACFLSTITDIEFWPHWDYQGKFAEEGRRYVEPDVVIKMADRKIVIIEAKNNSTTLQYREQWKREIDAAREMGFDVVGLIALDGNRSYAYSELLDTSIFKTSWSMLLNSVTKLLGQLEPSSYKRGVVEKLNQSAQQQVVNSWKRILNQVLLAFSILGYKPTKYLESFPPGNISVEATEFLTEQAKTYERNR